MAQNRSTAVMQRRNEAPDSLDYFPTPPWATRALCEWLQAEGHAIGEQSCWEPACGEGHMARPLAEYFRFVTASDVHDYSETYADQTSVGDFLMTWNHSPKIQAQGVGWIITNPPFRLAQEFIATGLAVSKIGVAVLVRSAFLEAKERYATLFSQTRPTDILQFVERVAMVRGRLDGDASSATAYCWIVWRKDAIGPGTRFDWIAPCRTRLERASDYPRIARDLAPAPLFDLAPAPGSSETEAAA